MRPRSIRNSDRREEQFRGVLLIGAAICVGIALVVTYVWIRSKQTEFDQVTMCPKEGPRGLTIVLIDRTDPLNPVQKEALRKELEQVKEHLPQGTGIQVYSVGPVINNLLTAEGPLVCSPGRGDTTSPWTGNPRLVERRWREGFAQPLEAVFTKMLQSGSSERSPILESIQSIAVEPLGSLRSEAQYRHLVIVSDMLQNTHEFSQYKKQIPFSEFKLTEYYRRVRADLTHVKVEIFYVRREGNFQGARHIQFWEDYFKDCGATLDDVKALTG